MCINIDFGFYIILFHYNNVKILYEVSNYYD